MWIRISIPLLIFPQIPWKPHVCTVLAKDRFLPILVYIVSDCEYFQNFEGTLTLWRHSDVIRKRIVLFWYQWKEETNSYTLVANIRYRAFNIENPGRGLKQPPFGERVTENVSGGRGLITPYLLFPVNWDKCTGTVILMVFVIRISVETLKSEVKGRLPSSRVIWGQVRWKMLVFVIWNVFALKVGSPIGTKLGSKMQWVTLFVNEVKGHVPRSRIIRNEGHRMYLNQAKPHENCRPSLAQT